MLIEIRKVRRGPTHIVGFSTWILRHIHPYPEKNVFIEAARYEPFIIRQPSTRRDRFGMTRKSSFARSTIHIPKFQFFVIATRQNHRIIWTP